MANNKGEMSMKLTRAVSFWGAAYLLVSTVCAAEAPPVIISTGMSDAIYAPGSYVAPAPAVVPLNGINTSADTLDVSNHKDLSTCITFGSERSINGGLTWENNGKASACGKPNGFKDRVGNPISAISVGHGQSVTLPAGTLIRSILII